MLAVILPVLWFTSCERVDITGTEAAGAGPDSTWTRIGLSENVAVRNLNIFIYDDKGKLEHHSRFEGRPDSLRFRVTSGRKTAVCIVNSALEFNKEALTRYESAELLTYRMSDEYKEWPVMSCVDEFDTRDSLVLSPAVLRCAIRLEHIEHGYRNYKRMEDPTIRVENYPESAYVLKQDGHRSADAVSDTSGLRGLVWEKLPYDIGMYGQQPGTTVYCYPEDDAESASRPSIVIECSTDGKPYKFIGKLPLMKRGLTTLVSLVVGESPEKYEFSFRQSRN